MEEERKEETAEAAAEEAVETAEPTEPEGESAKEETEETAGEVEGEDREPEADFDETDITPAIAPKKKQTAQERFDELTWKRREAERQAEYWRKKAEEAERKAPEATAAAAPKGLPKEEDFDNYGEFVKAVVAYEFNKRQENTAAERARESEIQAVIAFNRKADRLREKFEDYDEVVQRPVFSTAMQKILWQSDNGPQLAYYLGRPENEKIALRIGNLDEAMAAYEIGRLEQKLIVAAKARKTTSAPPPVKPIAPLSKPAEGEIKDDDEWFKLEKQREIEKLKKRLGG
jgi:hypothetical protein